jgi:flavin reductase (DIM6/NTAB) family NADH-FMN oxidoreductase RutF
VPSSHPATPHELTEPLELDPADWEPREVYFLMTGLVVPRPIAWVSTQSPDGVRNLAPHSYFNVMANDPPHVVIGSSGRKDTLRNIESTGELVVNLVSMDVVEPMNFTATDFPSGEDEFAWAGLEAAPSATVTPPRVAAAKAHLECRLVQVVEAGNGHIVVARVTHLHVDPSVWRDGRVDPVLLDPVCRLAGTSYARLGDVFKLARPTWEADVAGTEPGSAIPRLGD